MIEILVSIAFAIVAGLVTTGLAFLATIEADDET